MRFGEGGEGTYHSMELRALIPQWLAIGALGLADAELPEVLGRLGDDAAEELDFDAPEGLAAEGHVEEDDGVVGVAGGCWGV